MRYRNYTKVGWRARIGVISPALGLAVTSDFHKIAPEGVALLLARVAKPLVEDSVEELTEVGSYAPDAAKQLVSANPDVVVWNTSTGSLMKGIGYDQELIRRIEEAVHIPATTASTAMLEAFKKLGLKKVCLAMPYIDAVNEHEKKFIEDNGFKVLGYKGLQILNVAELIDTSPSTMYRLAKEADQPEADGIFISCAGLSVLDIIEKLEHDLGKPVLATNQVSLWHAFQIAKVREPIEGYGVLLREP